MTDRELDRQLLKAVEDADHDVLTQPAVRAAKQQLIDTLAAATQKATDDAAAAARAEAERRAADPRYALDFDRTECSPNCEANQRPWGWEHTRTLGMCAQAKRPQADPATVLALACHLDDVLDVYEYESGGIQDDPQDIADYALMWLRDHPEAIRAIWPDLGDTRSPRPPTMAEAFAMVRDDILREEQRNRGD